jgi:ribonuclease-3
MTDYTKVAEKLGLKFNDIELLKRAFVHRSYINENQGTGLKHNERLEFLGDAVLELAASVELFGKYPDRPEGELTAFRASIVNTVSLADTAEELQFSNYLMLSRGESKDTGKARQSILADTFEAVIGAIFLDQGFDSAEAFIGKNLYHKLDEIVEKGLWRDAKSFVQEKSQEILGETPHYRVTGESGADHDKTFTIGIYFGKELVAEGDGKSKQDAEQIAAQKALNLKKWN